MEQHPATSAPQPATSETTDVVLRAPCPSSPAKRDRAPRRRVLLRPGRPLRRHHELEARSRQRTWTFARELLAEGLYSPPVTATSRCGRA